MILERLQFYIRHSLNDLLVNRQRTVFGLLCIAAGVGAIIGLLTLSDMIENSVTGNLAETNRGDIRITSFFQGDDEFDAFEDAQEDAQDRGLLNENGGFTALGVDAVEQFLRDTFGDEIDTVTYSMGVSERFFGSIQVVDGDGLVPISQPFFVQPDEYPLYGEIEDDGRSLEEMLSSPTDIVLSENLANDLDAEVGDVVRLSGAAEDFTVRGIVDTLTESGFDNIFGSLFGYFYADIEALRFFEPPLEDGAYVPLADVELNVDRIYIKTASSDQLETIGNAIQARFLFTTATTTDDLLEQGEDLSAGLDQLFSVMGLAALLIGGIGIVNTMLVIVQRRTTEVAVLKTIGLEPGEVTTLFLVEAIIMGVVGSLLGIPFSWAVTLAAEGFAETFLSQGLSFTISLGPLLTGLAVGVVVTAVFGFIPTLSAGQVRPILVLRPGDSVIPRAGLVRSFAALMIIFLAMALLAQGLIGPLVVVDDLTPFSMFASVVVALLLGIAAVGGGLSSDWTGDNIILKIIRWGLLLVGLPILGGLFGSQVQAILLVLGTFVVLGNVYVVLWFLTWAAAGGRIQDLWPGALILAIPFFWPSIPFLIVMVPPAWFLGWIIQRYTFVDLKIGMRAMLATKGRIASTLLGLVVGVFVLSLVWMLTTVLRDTFEELVVDLTGGNALIFVIDDGQTPDELQTRLDGLDYVDSASRVNTYSTAFVSLEDVSTGEVLQLEDLNARIDGFGELEALEEQLEETFTSLDARDVTGNLPSVDFADGSQLTPADDGEPVIVIPSSVITQDVDIEVGDRLTVAFINDSRREEATFTIVGMTDRTGVQSISLDAGSDLYIPLNSAPENVRPEGVSFIVDIAEDDISQLRRDLSDLGGVFVLEARLLSDIINSILDAFTGLPLLVSVIVLLTGGFVIANSVALSTMERRRQIAIMKAIGLARRRVLTMLLLENTIMGLLGGLIGVGTAVVILTLLLQLVFDDALGSTAPYGSALLLMLAVVGIALVAAIFSVWGASGEKPLRVLRYE